MTSATQAPQAVAKRRTSFPVMGTVASLVAWATAADFAAAARGVQGTLVAADRRFSPYRTDSELSRMRRGEVAPPGVSADMAAVLRGCSLMETLTDGAFRATTPIGTIDPIGFVKGWAMARARQSFADVGVTDWLLSVGGDVVGAGGTGGAPWNVAVRHPDQAGRVARIIPLSAGAVATSGDYERGSHIWNPAGAARARRGSVTVVGPRIETADALATACWAIGHDGLILIRRMPQYQVMYLDAEGATASAGFPLVAVAA